MIETLKTTWYLWQSYWNLSPVVMLFVLSGLYLLWLSRRDMIARLLCVYTICIGIIIVFPVSASILHRLIGSDIYWRTFWLLPLVPVVGYTLCSIASKLSARDNKLGIAAIAAGLLVIALCGKSQFTEGGFIRPGNLQQIPDEVIQLGQIIQEDAAANQMENVTVASDDYIATYLRIYDPSILMPYGRARMGAVDRNARRLYRRFMDKNRPGRLARRSHIAMCDYIILDPPEDDDTYLEKIESKGYTVIGQVDSYYVMKEEPGYREWAIEKRKKLEKRWEERDKAKAEKAAAS